VSLTAYSYTVTMFRDLYIYYKGQHQNLHLWLVLYFVAIASYPSHDHIQITTSLAQHQKFEKVLNWYDISSDNSRYLFVVGKDLKKQNLTSAKCISVWKPYPMLPDTQVALASASECFEMPPAPPWSFVKRSRTLQERSHVLLKAPAVMEVHSGCYKIWLLG